MTTHFMDFQVRPDAEMSESHLMGALYDKLHLVLARQHRDDIGVSFPYYSLNPRTPGPVLRIHGRADALAELTDNEWLGGMRDYVRIGEMATTPDDARHRTVQRRQFKTSAARLRRRRMRRKGETEARAREAIPDSVERLANLPFVHLHSRSSGQAYCMFIGLGPLQDHPAVGKFNSYGLSNVTTVPWF